MGEIKQSDFADGVGYLYRAALYLAKGDQKSSILFLQTAVKKIGKDKLYALDPIVCNSTIFRDDKERLLWAERILDEYKRLFFLLPREDSNLQPSS